MMGKSPQEVEPRFCLFARRMLRPWLSFRLSENAGKERLSRGLEMCEIICAKPDPGECMATTLKTTPPCVAIDATLLIALCARELDKIAAAEREMERYAQEGYDFYAPGVILAESLFVLCRKLQDSILSALDHANAIDDLRDYMTIINSPPNGDGSLVARAEQIRIWMQSVGGRHLYRTGRGSDGARDGRIGHF